MPIARELLVGVTLAATLGVADGAEPARRPAKGDGLLDARSLDTRSLGGDRKAPITVTADTLEYDYKTNVVVYRGTVQVTQGDVKVRSETLTVTLVRNGTDASTKDPPDPTARGAQRVQDIVAVGNVRIDHGTRWATGGRAVFDQTERTLVLTEDPMLHDGANEVAGERVVVYLDEDRSVVEGGRRRVKAVLYPGKDEVPDKAAEEPAAGEASTAQAAVP